MKWTPLPIQEKFLQATEDEVLVGGAAGGSKSEMLLAFCIMRAMKYPGTSHAFFRRTLPELERGRGPIPRSRELLTGIAEWSERKMWWTFPNGSKLEFSHCEREEDVNRHDGAEYTTVAIDQCEQFTEFQVDYLRSRNRCSVPGVRSLLRLSANPQGVGMGWLRRCFIDHSPTRDGSSVADGGIPMEGAWEHELYNGQTISRRFIPARIADNKYLSGTDYEKKLMAITDEKTRKALLDGRWDMFAGKYFTEFTPTKHVCVRPAQEWYQKFVGMDYGYSAPFAALWASLDEHGRVHVYRELYQSRLKDEEQARMVLNMSGNDTILSYKADPSAWNKRGETGRSPSEVWAHAGLHANKANNERLLGWSRMRSLLSTDFEGIPSLTIDPRCSNLIRELSEAVHDERKQEDLDTKQSDHALDALRYVVADLRNRPSESPRPIMWDFKKLAEYQAQEEQKVLYGSGEGAQWS